MLGTGRHRRRGTGLVILTVALNATVNVTYEADEIAWGASNHVSRMTCRAGGGSLAVARVLAGLGEDVLVAGFAGGGAADLIEADLARAGVATAFTRIGRESRRVVEVLDELRLRVGLEAVHLELKLAAELRYPALEFDQRERPVVRRVAATQHVQVDAVHHRDAVANGAHAHSSASA